MKLGEGLEVLEINSTIMGKESLIYPTLIYDKNEALLIDAGYPGESTLIINAINNGEITFDKVDKILLTHHDIDHIGGLKSLIEKSNNKIKTFAYIDEIPFINGDEPPLKLSSLEKNLNNLSDSMNNIYTLLKKGFNASKVEIDIPLRDHEIINLNGEIEVIHTYGHTKGHICLYVKKYKTLIAGDLLTVKDGALLPSDPSIHFDADAANHCIEKLCNYDIEKIICYHGGLYSHNVNDTLKNLIK